MKRQGPEHRYSNESAVENNGKQMEIGTMLFLHDEEQQGAI
jgi:hypothetical protein